jgi:hypothetical protein
MTDRPRSEWGRRTDPPRLPPKLPMLLPTEQAQRLLGLRGPALALARALTGREGLQGKDLVLRARIGKDGSVVLAYDVLRSPENSVLMLLPVL